MLTIRRKKQGTYIKMISISKTNDNSKQNTTGISIFLNNLCFNSFLTLLLWKSKFSNAESVVTHMHKSLIRCLNIRNQLKVSCGEDIIILWHHHVMWASCVMALKWGLLFYCCCWTGSVLFRLWHGSPKTPRKIVFTSNVPWYYGLVKFC